MKKYLRIILYGLGGLIAVVLIAVAIAGFAINQQLEKHGGIGGYIENTLGETIGDTRITVADAGIRFRAAAAPLRLVLDGVTLAANGAEVSVPQLELGFAVLNLVQGELTPSLVEIRDAEIPLRRDANGWQAGVLSEILGAAIAGGGGLTGWQGVPGEIRLSDSRLTVAHPDGDAAASAVVPLAMTLTHDGGQYQVNIAAGGAVVTVAGDTDLTAARIAASLASVDVRRAYPYLGLDLPEISGLGVVDGTLALTIGGGAATAISGNLTSRDGRLALPGYEGFAYETASLAFTHDIAGDVLTVEEIDMRVASASGDPDAHIVLSGQVSGMASATPAVALSARGANLPLNAMLDAWPVGFQPELKSAVAGNISGGVFAALGFEIAGVIDRPNRVFRPARFDLVSEARDMQLDTGMGTVERLTGNLSSRLELSVTAGGEIAHASANFLLVDGEIAPLYSDRVIGLAGIELHARLEGDVVHISRAAIDANNLGEMALTAKLGIDPGWRPRSLVLNIRAENIDKVLLTEFWPQTLRGGAARWVDAHVHGGIISGVTIDTAFDFAGGDTPPRDLYLNGAFELSDAALTYNPNLPVVTNLSGAIEFDDEILVVNVTSGESEGIDIASSGFTIILGEEGTPHRARLELNAAGDFAGAVGLIDNETINLLKPAGITPRNVSGEVTAEVSIGWDIPPPGERIAGFDISVDGRASGAAMAGLPFGTAVTGADFDIVYGNRDLRINGDGLFEGAPSQFNFTRDAAGAFNLDLTTGTSAAVMGFVAGSLPDTVPLDLGGEAAATIALRNAGRADDGMELTFALDLENAVLRNPAFGIAKEAGQAARLDAAFGLAGGRVTAIDRIRLYSGALALDGGVDFDTGGDFRTARFSLLRWGDNEIRNLVIDNNPGGIATITAEADRIDLTPLRGDGNPADGFAVRFDITAEQIVIDPLVALSGNAVFRTGADGLGTGQFLGDLYLKGDPFMTQSALDFTFGGGQDIIRGRGLLGGAETSIILRTADEGTGNTMMLESDNAGQVLKALNVTDAIRSGGLRMEAQFDNGNADNYEVVFELEDFNVIEAPRAVRALSVLSLAGLYSLVEGDGTRFGDGYAHLEVSPDVQKIHQARATGAALAVEVVGQIDPNARQMEISGNLVPIYLISDIIGRVPLVGGLVTGLDNSGVFATQFTMNGDFDDPDTRVNNASILPGFVRDIFSPDWVKREGERINTPDNNAAQ